MFRQEFNADAECQWQVTRWASICAIIAGLRKLWYDMVEVYEAAPVAMGLEQAACGGISNRVVPIVRA